MLSEFALVSRGWFDGTYSPCEVLCEPSYAISGSHDWMATIGSPSLHVYDFTPWLGLRSRFQASGFWGITNVAQYEIPKSDFVWSWFGHPDSPNLRKANFSEFRVELPTDLFRLLAFERMIILPNPDSPVEFGIDFVLAIWVFGCLETLRLSKFLKGFVPECPFWNP